MNLQINSNKGELPPIYLIAENSKNREFKPATSSSSSQKPDKWHTYNSIPINWNIFSSSNFDSWEPRSESQFESEHKNIQAYYVTDQNNFPHPIIKYFVIEKDKITTTVPDFLEICEVETSLIKFKEDFSRFLNRIYKSKDHKFKITATLKYNNKLFQNNDINKITLTREDDIQIRLGDLGASIKKSEEELKDTIKKNKKDIEEKSKKLSNLKAEFNKQFPFIKDQSRNWKNFVDEVKKKIKEAEQKKLDVTQFKQVFLYNGAQKVQDFLNSYSNLKQNEKFITSLSKLSEIDPEVKKWFFFNGKEWSLNQFEEQFDKQKYNSKKQDIENIDKEIKNLVVTNNGLLQEIANLEKLKKEQKATLNFYLEEDTEPFLTTDVTIPFRPQPEPPLVITEKTPPPSP